MTNTSIAAAHCANRMVVLSLDLVGLKIDGRLIGHGVTSFVTGP